MSVEKNPLIVLQQKANDLNREAWNVRVTDSTLAYKLSQEAIAVSLEIDFTKGKAEGFRTLAFCNIRLSKHDEALPLLQSAEELFKLLEDVCGQSDVVEYYGIIARSKGDYASSLNYLYKSLELRQQENYKEGISHSLYHLGVTYRYMGNLEQALDFFQKDLPYSREIGNWIGESYSLNNIGSIYFELGDYPNALEYFRQSLIMRTQSGDKWGEAGCLDNIGLTYFKLREFDKAVEFCKKSLEIARDVDDKKGQGNSLYHLAGIYSAQDEPQQALAYANESLGIREETGDKKGQAEVYCCLAEVTEGGLSAEEALNKQTAFLDKALMLGKETKALDLLSRIHYNLFLLFRKKNEYAAALQHLESYNAIQNEIHSNTVRQKVLNLEITHKVEQSRKETEIFRLRNIELVGLYEEIKNQKEEIEVQKKIVEESLAELKETQKQLIQREKMASLGELTAGIAHEIQNPLNFVNNFSELNTELISEMKTELLAGKTEDAISIAKDIDENEQKINHHGKRADAIVKGMLQHSRVGTAVKELTDINALADDYLRLSYHGLRAIDKTLNATMQKDFDETIGKINIIPQDIGRVLLNLYNNAFYSVTEKKKHFDKNLPAGQAGFEPTISVSTKKLRDKIQITVRDNGNGIPQKVADKIFQPFFTTKPTGQGTGLGLSLSYDIIKAHGGDIKMETREGEFTAFTIELPNARGENSVIINN
jgi:two-component system NtrC family sensor kinase